MLIRPGEFRNTAPTYHAIWILEQAVGIDGLAFMIWRHGARGAAIEITVLLACQALFVLAFFARIAPRLAHAPAPLRLESAPAGPALWLATTYPLTVAILVLIAVAGAR